MENANSKVFRVVSDLVSEGADTCTLYTYIVGVKGSGGVNYNADNADLRGHFLFPWKVVNNS